jgi:uncharacterized membrane protein
MFLRLKTMVSRTIMIWNGRHGYIQRPVITEPHLTVGDAMSGGLNLLTGVAALGSATVGGVFYGFSTFIMRGLRQLPPASGAAAMQQINIAAVRPGLMAALFGTAAACTALAVWTAVRGPSQRSVAVVAGSVLYLAGAVGVTAAFNVPLNNALAALDPNALGIEPIWQDYLRRWNAGNHLRTLGCLAAAALYVWALTIGDD